MSVLGQFWQLSSVQRNTFIACFLGWSLDAFDFFTVTFCITAIAAEFHTTKTAVFVSVGLTLIMRPVGAFLFGLMADRYGRRPALMLDIVCYSVFELASAFAPSLTVFLILRALFGIAMGGEWGVGAALAFETLPAEGRGSFSGLLQEGYVVGNLLVALVYGTLFPHIGWRGMFIVGALPAFLIIYIRTKVDESPAWLAGQVSREAEHNLSRDIMKNFGTFLFLVILMFSFNSFSHGTQDVYPTFLQNDRGFSPQMVGRITIVLNIGALLGGICFGTFSERIGRRKAIVVAALLAIPAIPLWVFSNTTAMLAIGGFAMQFMVQGAWGVIPAHLNELSPASVRGTLPGFAYQLGNALSSQNSVFQSAVASRYYHGKYAPVMGWTVLIVAILVAIVTMSGREARGADLSDTSNRPRTAA